MPEPSTTGPKDVFLQLLLIIALYLAATHLGALLFQIVDHYLPDVALHGSFERSSLKQVARWSISMLIIAAPVFFFITRYLRRVYAVAPETLQLRSRRWLVAFTLFAAALIAIGDLIAIVHRFLQGELTLRFLLKALVVFVIAGAVLIYERWEFRRAHGQLPPYIITLRWGAIIVAIASIAAGFGITGSPWRARLEQIDLLRLNNLQDVQWRIVEFWQHKQLLPASLDALRDDISGYRAPIDPQTGEPYEYRVLGAFQFELCATFSAEASAQTLPGARPVAPYGADDHFDDWAHGAERTCFTRTIDPDRYPPVHEQLPKPSM